MVLDWRRVGRSATVSWLTDDVPFALWARFMWDGFERLKPALLSASFLPVWLRAALASPIGSRL